MGSWGPISGGRDTGGRPQKKAAPQAPGRRQAGSKAVAAYGWRPVPAFSRGFHIGNVGAGKGLKAAPGGCFRAPLGPGPRRHGTNHKGKTEKM